MSTTTSIMSDLSAVDAEAVRPGARVPDLFPFARQPVWVMVAGRPLKERAVLEFLIAHVNEQTGRLTAFPGVRTIAEAVGLEPRAVRYAIAGLVEFGAVEVVPTYLDRVTGERTFEPATGGESNAQTSNTFAPCLSPPGGMLYPGPITLAEWYDQRCGNDPRKGTHRRLIDKRIAEARARQARVRTTRPTENTSSGGGASVCTPPPAHRCTPPLHTDAPKEDQEDLDQVESVRPFRNARTQAHAGARDGHAPAAGPVQRTDGWTEDFPEKEDGPAGLSSGGPYESCGSSLSGEDRVPGVTTPEEDREGLEALSGPGGELVVPVPRSEPVPEQVLARTEAEAEAEQETVAERLLSEVRVKAELSRLDCRPGQRVRLVELVAGALASGHELDRVRGYVLGKCRETTARRMAYLLRAFSPQQVGDLAEAIPVPSPGVTAVQASERLAGQLATRAESQARRDAAAPPAGTPAARKLVSPVGWVSDQQYAGLSPGDRAVLSALAGRPDTELTAFEQQRLHRIRQHLNTSDTSTLHSA